MTSAPAPAIARPPAAIEVPTSPTAGSAATRQQIRGSSLLLTGRLLSLAVNFATQVLIVRYLSKTDFGAFAYGLSIVSLGESVALLGLDKAIPRFLPIYQEQGAFGKMFGTLLMAAGTV